MSNYDILFVDDEPRALQAFERLMGRRFSIRITGSAADALTILEDDGPAAVIVSDMKMPGMDGIQLLAKVKELYPDMVRILFTGNADLKTAIEAVNNGQIFRFLTKPVNPQALIASLELAVEQYRLITAEKELLNQTLKGSVKVLCELLSLAHPTAFSSGYRIKKSVVKIAEKLQQDRRWQFEIAALMCMIGCIAVPEDILKKIRSGAELTPKEREMYRNHPKFGAKLIGRIPRLHQVAAIIENQMLPWEDYGREPASLLAKEVQLGAQILRATIDHDHLLFRGIGHHEALHTLALRQGAYNPKILEMLARDEIAPERLKIIVVNFEDIVPGMIADEDILAQNGALIIPCGQEITWPVIQELNNYLEHIGIRDPIRVRVNDSEHR